jgi:hypothetical protein
MTKALRIVLVLTILAIVGYTPAAWATAISSEPRTWPGPRQAQITKASRDFISVVGHQAQITAIRGNQITIKHLNDPARTVTVTVDNATLFRVGQHVNVTERLLTPQ